MSKQSQGRRNPPSMPLPPDPQTAALLDRLDEHVIYLDTAMKILWANRAACESAGKTRESLPGEYCYRIWPRRNAPCTICPVAQAVATGKSQQERVSTPDGRSWLIKGDPLREETGRIVGGIEITLETTDSTRNEDSLEETGEKHRSLTQNISVGIYRNTPGPHGRFIEANPALIRMFGFESREEFLKTSVSDLYQNPEDRERFNRKMLRDKAVRKEELVLKRKDGECFWGSVTANAIHDSKGRVLYYDGLIEEVTERKEAEQARERAESALREREEKYRRIFENFQDLYYRTDAKGAIVELSPSLTPLSGYTPEEVLGRSVYTFYKDRRDRIEFMKELKQKGRVIDYELLLVGKNDRSIPVSISSQVLYDASGDFIGIEGVVRDITERKHAEDALRESEARYRNVYNTAPLAFVLYDRDCRVTDWNVYAENIFGWTRKEVIGKNFFDFLIPPESRPQIQDIVESLMQGKLPSYSVNENLTKDGNRITCEWNNSILYDGNGDVIGAISLGLDITDRKKSEEKIQASLREKEILLKEVHHRVKNNMQVISSLLSLQSQHVRDEQDLRLFQESQRRVRSMALVHEKLYQSENFAGIDFSDYIRDLAMRLYRSYGTNREKITLHVDVQKISLGIDLAVPCGLIVNELVSNALKHAFPPDAERGLLSITLHEEEGRIVLCVSDDGIGIPPGFDIRKTGSLGLRLILLLAEEQLEGTVSLDRSAGTAFRILIPKN